MKKTILTATLAAALIIGGGTGLYYVSAQTKGEITDNNTPNGNMNTENMTNMMQGNMSEMMNGDMQSMMDGDMQDMMNDKNLNFDQMKEHMKEVHP